MPFGILKFFCAALLLFSFMDVFPDGRVKIFGKVAIDAADRSVSFPGRLNIRSGIIEIIVSTPRGRSHESLVVTDVDPFNLQMALILAGHENAPLEKGAGFAIEISFDKKKWVNVDSLLFDTTAGEPKKISQYVFVGSSFKNKRCLASLEGNLANINSMDRNTILDNRLDGGRRKHEYIVLEKKLPEAKLKDASRQLLGVEETPLTVRIRPFVTEKKAK